MLLLKAESGEHISTFVHKVCICAKALNEPIMFEFNNVNIYVSPDDNAESVIACYRESLEYSKFLLPMKDNGK